MAIQLEETPHLLKSGILCKLAYHDFIPTKLLQLADIEEAVFVKDPKRRHVRLWLMYERGTKRAYVVFRGTDSLHTALINTHAALVPFKGKGKSEVSDWSGSVHKGYKDIALFARDLIGTELDSKTDLVLTGHSMGGACAQLFGAVVSQEFKNIETITFGAPPVGDTDFCASFKHHIPNTRRVVHEYDIVPRLPIPFFKHTHGLKLIRHQPGEKRPCTMGPHSARDLAQFIRYHQMNSYITPLRRQGVALKTAF